MTQPYTTQASQVLDFGFSNYGDGATGLTFQDFGATQDHVGTLQFSDFTQARGAPWRLPLTSRRRPLLHTQILLPPRP